MTRPRHKPPYWRRSIPIAQFDIAKLRPQSLPRGQRFETRRDTDEESVRSQALLERHRQDRSHGVYLQDCRDGHYQCDRTYCPRCGRTYRRYLIGELLRLHSKFDGEVRFLVVLLEAAPQGRLRDLQIARYLHSLRKRLVRAGLAHVAVIGGFEMVYRARSKEWMLHINLVMFGGAAKAIAKFEAGLERDGLYRPADCVSVENPAEQLSYALKFTTYHRPRQQRGPKKTKAVPLNPAEHVELVRWMAQHEFTDHLFLFNARRHGVAIELSTKDSRKA